MTNQAGPHWYCFIVLKLFSIPSAKGGNILDLLGDKFGTDIVMSDTVMAIYTVYPFIQMQPVGDYVILHRCNNPSFAMTCGTGFIRNETLGNYRCVKKSTPMPISKIFEFNISMTL
jgi:hypothetical protein